MGRIKTFKFERNKAQSLDYIDGFINDWLASNDGILVHSSAAYGSNGQLLITVIYEVVPIEEKKQITVSDYLEKNANIFTILGVFVALTMLSLSIPQEKNTTYLTVASISLTLIILFDLYYFRSPKGEKSSTLIIFWAFFQTFILYLVIFWAVKYRSISKLYDQLWATYIFIAMFGFVLKKFPKMQEYFKDKDDGYFLRRLIILGTIYLLGTIPLTFTVRYGLDWLTYFMTRK